MYALLTYYTGTEEYYESPISVLDREIGYMCRTYKTTLNRRVYNSSYQGTNSQVY